MDLSPHLSFDGCCAEAFAFYEKQLGGRSVMMMKYGETPAANETPPDWKDKVIHATLEFGGHRLTGCDVPPDKYQRTHGIAVLFSVESASDAERIFHALEQGGEVQMPMQETFWATRFGMLRDRFGTPWMINCGKPM